MTAITIARDSLRSRVIRETVGDRTIDLFASLNQGEDEATGPLGALLSLGGRLLGFITGAAMSGLGWLASNLFDLIVEAIFEIVTFDWNQLDTDIQDTIDNNTTQIFAALGGAAGRGTAWLAAIGISSAVSIKFPVLGGAVALRLAEEGGEEIRSALRAAATQASQLMTRSAVAATFLNGRRIRRWILNEPERTQPLPTWTIAQGFENLIETIAGDNIRAFVENFFEELFESLIEVGYVVNYAIDDYYTAARRASEATFGEQRALIITPDRRAENENVILRGPQTLIQQNTQTALVQHAIVKNRDVGQIVGQPAGDWMKAGIQRRLMTLTFRNKEQPPWTMPAGERIKEITVTIPDARMGLTWTEIKSVARPWTWGRFRATANLDNGRKLKIHGATEQEAENTLRQFATLTTAEILTLSVTEEKDRHPDLRKEPERVYPSFGVLLVRRRVSGDSGLTDLEGQSYDDSRIRFELWPSEEPDGLPPLT